MQHVMIVTLAETALTRRDGKGTPRLYYHRGFRLKVDEATRVMLHCVWYACMHRTSILQAMLYDIDTLHTCPGQVGMQERNMTHRRCWVSSTIRCKTTGKV